MRYRTEASILPSNEDLGFPSLRNKCEERVPKSLTGAEEKIAMECPICHGTDDICHSHRRGFDWLLAFLLLLPYRCWNCYRRFYHFRLPRLPGGLHCCSRGQRIADAEHCESGTQSAEASGTSVLGFGPLPWQLLMISTLKKVQNEARAELSAFYFCMLCYSAMLLFLLTGLLLKWEMTIP